MKPPSLFSEPALEIGERVVEPHLASSLGDEQHFLLSSANVNRHGHQYFVGVALDETFSRDSLDDFRTNTWIGLFAAAGLLGIAGAFVARQAMQPLARITAATQSIDVTRFDVRLDDSTWPAELRAMVSEFTRMQLRLRESFERLAQFSDNIAHELRTPVANLTGTAEVALASPRSADE